MWGRKPGAHAPTGRKGATMQDEKNNASSFAGFELGTPALVCRWRLANRTLPLENRHLRALSTRTVGGSVVSTQLVAWAKQHIEWTLADGSAPHPNGVLMLVMDTEGRAAMSVGPYDLLASASAADLAARAVAAAHEARATGVAPETLWAVRAGALVCGTEPGWRPSGIDSLVADLAKTLGVPVCHDPLLAASVLDGEKNLDALPTAEKNLDARRDEESPAGETCAAPALCDELFLASDEHGIVPAAGLAGPHAHRLVDGYAKLLEAANRR